jgi:hypothetical protein
VSTAKRRSCPLPKLIHPDFQNKSARHYETKQIAEDDEPEVRAWRALSDPERQQVIHLDLVKEQLLEQMADSGEIDEEYDDPDLWDLVENHPSTGEYRLVLREEGMPTALKSVTTGEVYFGPLKK